MRQLPPLFFLKPLPNLISTYEQRLTAEVPDLNPSPPFHYNDRSCWTVFSQSWQTAARPAQVTLSISCAGSGYRRGARRRGFKALHVKCLPLQWYLTLHLHIHIFRGQRLAFLSVQDEEISGRRASVFSIRFKGSLSLSGRLQLSGSAANSCGSWHFEPLKSASICQLGCNDN